jgi:glycosyltransferase involved in cell wall biosynthesis
MQIAHFTNTYKPNINGVVRSVSTFRKSLTQMGHNVFIFSQDTQDYEDSEPFVFRYPALSIPTVDYSFTIPVSPFVDWLIPSLKLDVIHSNHPVLLGNAAADKAEKLNIPLVFTFHTRYEEYSHYIPFSQAFVKEIIVDWLLRYVERCQHVITPSESIRQMLIKSSGITDHITTIPTGIDLNPYQEVSGASIRNKLNWGKERILITIGRLAAEKNLKTLLSACALAMEADPNTRLIVIGDGPQKDDLKKFTKELGISELVHFTGLVPFEQIPRYLKAADAFCFASVSETQGLVTMEAMAAGLPVVAVRGTGTTEIVQDGETGFLTENNPESLAQAIKQVFENPDLYKSFQNAALETSQSFATSVQAQKMMQVYEQAIEDKKAGRSIKANLEALNERKNRAITTVKSSSTN